jgi:hypothetical protein
MSAAEWAAARRAEAILPAGKVTPSPRPDGEDGSRAREYLPRENRTPAVREVVALVERLGPPLIGHAVHVEVANDITWPFAATFGNFRFTFNVGRLGYAWFEGETAAIFDLIVHEFGHAKCGNHLAEEYYSALTVIGGKMVALALREPLLFEMHRHGRPANGAASAATPAACVPG